MEAVVGRIFFSLRLHRRIFSSASANRLGTRKAPAAHCSCRRWAYNEARRLLIAVKVVALAQSVVDRRRRDIAPLATPV